VPGVLASCVTLQYAVLQLTHQTPGGTATTGLPGCKNGDDMGTPNTWARATVKNDWGSEISIINLKHRYDNDHYDEHSWPSIDQGASGESFKVGYWTGFGRTGKDYWLITFEADGKLWSCKDNFYCFLTSDDENMEVVCRVYQENGNGKMEVMCPGSSNCTVSLQSAVSKPNTWATATVRNDWGEEITKVQLNHRYDNDHFDAKSWASIDNGASGESFKVGYWTGFGRTGKDYWLINFEAGGKLWNCKDNFYCFLKGDDKNKEVVCRVYQDNGSGKMEVQCPGSSNCTVSLDSTIIPSAVNRTANRPVYVIGHRCNDPGDIGIALNKGANAIECDLQYDKKSKQVFVNHDGDSGTNLSEWLNSAKHNMAIYPSQFALIIFDCKFATGDPSHTADAMEATRKLIRSFLNANETIPMNVLFSIADYGNRGAFEIIMGDLLPNEGIAIDQSDDPKTVQGFFEQKGVTNCWYGDGIITPVPKDVHEYILEGCKLRDEKGIPKKVYVWTLAKKSSIKKYFDDTHVDGVMVNVPGTLTVFDITGLQEALQVVNESSVVRMAKREDNAFLVYSNLTGTYKTKTQWWSDFFDPLIFKSDGTLEIAGTAITSSYDPATSSLSFDWTRIKDTTAKATIRFSRDKGKKTFSGSIRPRKQDGPVSYSGEET
jgi:hypothetical protein